MFHSEFFKERKEDKNKKAVTVNVTQLVTNTPNTTSKNDTPPRLRQVYRKIHLYPIDSPVEFDAGQTCP